MKRILALLAVLTSLNVNADVELKSSDYDQLMVNNTPSMPTLKMYNSDGTLVPNVTILSTDYAYNEDWNNNVTAMIHLSSGDKAVFRIDKTGGVYDVNGTWLYGGENCEVIGFQSQAIYVQSLIIDSVVDGGDGSVYVVDFSSNIVGHSSRTCDDNSGDMRTGYSVEYSDNLTDLIDEFTDSLLPPLIVTHNTTNQ